MFEILDAMGHVYVKTDAVFDRGELNAFIEALIVARDLMYDPDPNFVVPGRIPNY